MKAITTGILVIALMFTTANAVPSKGDDFNSVVKMIEQFYRVKHVGPFLASRDEGCHDSGAHQGAPRNELRKRAASSSRCLKIRNSTAILRSFVLRLTRR